MKMRRYDRQHPHLYQGPGPFEHGYDGCHVCGFGPGAWFHNPYEVQAYDAAQSLQAESDLIALEMAKPEAEREWSYGGPGQYISDGLMRIVDPDAPIGTRSAERGGGICAGAAAALNDLHPGLFP